MRRAEALCGEQATAQLSLLRYMLSRSNGAFVCPMGHRRLADHRGVHRRTVQRQLFALTQAGLLHAEHEMVDGRARARYVLHVEAVTA
ncbi:hypothetical protein [Actinomadura violacea]|uniref:Helix-turn-helix domain-containing protein n=1 Tax=Actinomadura violacea TaxID=2819934 RepID=A0ABS3RY21_9ACTN|nr:hypothetical protein [Actinomadura violacea]MBO2461652.1 hypothetical protein [Actinomadura violacea]